MALTSLAPPIQASRRGLWGMPCRIGVGALNASAASHLVGGNTQQRMSVFCSSEDFVRHLLEAVILTPGFTRFSVSEPLKIFPPRKRERNSCAIPLLVQQVSVPHACRIVWLGDAVSAILQLQRFIREARQLDRTGIPPKIVPIDDARHALRALRLRHLRGVCALVWRHSGATL